MNDLEFVDRYAKPIEAMFKDRSDSAWIELTFNLGDLRRLFALAYAEATRRAQEKIV